MSESIATSVDLVRNVTHASMSENSSTSLPPFVIRPTTTGNFGLNTSYSLDVPSEGSFFDKLPVDQYYANHIIELSVECLQCICEVIHHSYSFTITFQPCNIDLNETDFDQNRQAAKRSIAPKQPIHRHRLRFTFHRTRCRLTLRRRHPRRSSLNCNDSAIRQFITCKLRRRSGRTNQANHFTFSTWTTASLRWRTMHESSTRRSVTIVCRSRLQLDVARRSRLVEFEGHQRRLPRWPMLTKCSKSVQTRKAVADRLDWPNDTGSMPGHRCTAGQPTILIDAHIRPSVQREQWPSTLVAIQPTVRKTADWAVPTLVWFISSKTSAPIWPCSIPTTIDDSTNAWTSWDFTKLVRS